MTKRQLSHSWRARKVYWTTFVISMDYLWLFLKSRLFGKGYFDKKITKIHIRSAYRLRRVFTELQGLFIKIGQLMSILSTFLPEEFRKPLEDFQDKAPAVGFETIQKIVEEELQSPLGTLFQNVESTPLASASIGQVHRATLKNGEKVVLKIQHQHIPLVADIDLTLFEKVNSLMAKIFKIKGMEQVAGEVRLMILEELDYGQEAKNMQAMRESLAEVENVIIPEIYPDLCTPRLLVSKFYEGVKINDMLQLDAWGIDKKQVVTEILQLSCKMVFKDGFYHADPHPGNILINEKAEMIWLDFGAVARLNPRMKSGMAKLIEALARQDTEAIVVALKSMNFVSSGDEARKFAEKLLDRVQDFLQNEIKMDSLNFKDIQFDPTTADFSKFMSLISFKDIANTFQVPKDYILLNRMLILITGISSELAPELNPLDVVRPYLRNMLLTDRKQLTHFLTDSLQSNLTTLLTLPSDLSKVLHKAKRGELELRLPALDDKTNAFYFLGQQFIFVVMGIAAATFGYLARADGFDKMHQWAMVALGISVFLYFRALVLGGRYRQKD